MPDSRTPELSTEAEKLLDAANGASDPARSAWLAFLGLLTYLVVTIATVSHKDLLLNSPVRLPIINADIPIVGFFQLAPVWMLLVYLSLLVQHVILARKYHKFTDAIASYEMETRTEHPARERVHSYVFSQILAGPEPDRITKFVMQLIVYATFTILPVLTLLFFQITFLPYHEVSITYWHRFVVILGFVMLIVLTRKWDIKVGPQAEARAAWGTQVLLILFLLPLVVGFSWLIATIPNEWIDRRLGFVAPTGVGVGAKEEAKLLNPLVRRFVDYEGSWAGWLLRYRVFVVGDTDLGTAKLRERNLWFARLNRSDLHRTVLIWADLRGAQMWRTRNTGINLKEAQLQGADLSYAKLQGADLSYAKLQGAHLSYANLQGADLSYANLQGADLKGAQLPGADLSYAKLQGADLEGAQLQDADLEGAELQGTVLASTDVWLVKFPRGLADQLPVPLGLADVKMSALTADAKAQLKQDLDTDITDPVVLPIVTARLEQILSNDPPNWEDGNSWQEDIRKAKEPSAEELARFHAGLACDDTEGYVATSMAGRAKAFETEHFGKGYAKPFASALLDENCRGGKALTDETSRAKLKNLISLPE